MGKTRLAAELAVEVHLDRCEVRYIAGGGPPEAARSAGARARRRTPAVAGARRRRPGRVELRAASGALVDELPAASARGGDGRGSGARAPTGRGRVAVLGPLEGDAVHAVARLYAGAAETGRSRSSGWLRERWCSAARASGRRRVGAREAARRLGVAAGRAASERTGLRAAEDDLAGGVARLQEVRSAPRSGTAREVVDARSRGWPGSMSRTRRCSSGASCWSRRWWRALRARRSSGSWDRRAAASPRCCGPGCWRRWRRAAAGQRALAARAAAPRRASAAGARARERQAPGRRATDRGDRPVRGGLHRLPRRGRARRVHRRARRLRARRAPPHARPRRVARRLLRPLRRLPGAGANCWAPTTFSWGRCAATSCDGRSSCLPAARA